MTAPERKKAYQLETIKHIEIKDNKNSTKAEIKQQLRKCRKLLQGKHKSNVSNVLIRQSKCRSETIGYTI